jgi:hypothetical protein
MKSVGEVDRRPKSVAYTTKSDKKVNQKMSLQIKTSKPSNPAPGALPAAIKTDVELAQSTETISIVAQFTSPDGEVGPNLNLPANLTPELLEILLNELLHNVR